MVKHYLQLVSPSQVTIDEIAFSDLIRVGNGQWLLRNGWDKWNGYRNARSLTSVAYDKSESKLYAQQLSAWSIFQCAPRGAILDARQRRNVYKTNKIDPREGKIR
jgi:hypothetical protein